MRIVVVIVLLIAFVYGSLSAYKGLMETALQYKADRMNRVMESQGLSNKYCVYGSRVDVCKQGDK